jgi:hypothetical protein
MLLRSFVLWLRLVNFDGRKQKAGGKTEGRRQKAESYLKVAARGRGSSEASQVVLSAFCLLPSAFCFLLSVFLSLSLR